MGQMMKKSLLVLLVLVFILSSSMVVYSEQTYTYRETVQFSFLQPMIKQSGCSSILTQMQTNSRLIKSNYYQVPMEVRDIMFPKGTTINHIVVSVGAIQTVHLDAPLPITPQAVPLNMLPLETSSTDNAPKTIKGWYEYRVGTGLYNNNPQLILHLEIYPIQYDAEKNSIQWTDTVTVMVDYEQPDASATLYDDIYQFLIIAYDEYISDLQPLVAHKNAQDISTVLVSLNDVYSGTYFEAIGRDDPEKIKYFIKNALDEWKIDNVLIVGSDKKIPARETHIKVSDSDTEVFVSDLYYADIYNATDEFSSWDTNNNNIFAEYHWEGKTDDLDLYPDVNFGRLACVDLTEVNTVVNKIITYENGEAYKQDWFSTLIVVGGDSFPMEDDLTNEGEFVNTAVIDIMEGFLPVKLWATNGILNGATPTGATAISDAITLGAGFVDFSGHGNTNVYATHPHQNDLIWLPTPFGGYFNTDIKELQNNEKLPIVVTGACSVGKFNRDNDCFSWSFLASPNGGGIASSGATGLGYAYIGEYVTYGLIEKIAIDMFNGYAADAKTFGAMWAHAVKRNIQSRMDAGELKTVLEWQSFGDPTLKIASESTPPEKPILSGQSSGRVKKEYTYEAVSTDIEGDRLYYLFKWSNDSYSDWLGPISSGQTISATHTWTKKGVYDVRVACKDEHGRRSDWSDPLPVSIPSVQNSFRTFSILQRLRTYLYTVQLLSQ